MSQADWDKASSAALALFAHGQAEAAQRGLLLVDTKYELGKDADGNILLLDEVRFCFCDVAFNFTRVLAVLDC
jgi:phosphoribosylaminoimidazole-succinocarboxamide synthase